MTAAEESSPAAAEESSPAAAEESSPAAAGDSGPAAAGMTVDGTAETPAAVPGAGMVADSGGAAGPQNRTTDVVPGPGGVMTDEVGVVTGDLTLRTEYADGKVTLRVQYKDADEWYAVTGTAVTLADPAGLDAVHGVAVGLLNRPEG